MLGIDRAFIERPDLKKRTYEAIAQHPELEKLFYDISAYVRTLQPSAGHDENGQVTKKRRLNDTGDANEDRDSKHGNGVSNGHWDKGTCSEIKEISFSVPQRKKLTLEIGNLPDQGLRATNPSTAEPEFQIQWSDVQHVVCLPVPEKAQVQYNFCVFTNESAEQVVWTVPGNVPKAGIVGSDIQAGPEETYKHLLIRVLNERLKNRRIKVVEPDEKEFVSQTVQAHRKGEKAVHVKGFRGSKDGFLFFLPTGIVWGFKKPLEFFPFDSISSVSYTSVLQRTFNLVISTTPSATSSETQEHEFSMLDQADFASIDAYIKRHQLQDASMAEQRRAKKLNINPTNRSTESDANPDGDEEEGELEKAKREAEEMEDEDEEEDENFDPGSEGESEGSGSSDEEQEEEAEEDGGEGDGGNIVAEELGSEAEVEDEEGE